MFSWGSVLCDKRSEYESNLISLTNEKGAYHNNAYRKLECLIQTIKGLKEINKESNAYEAKEHIDSLYSCITIITEFYRKLIIKEQKKDHKGLTIIEDNSTQQNFTMDLEEFDEIGRLIYLSCGHNDMYSLNELKALTVNLEKAGFC